jgi:hypothetical protein
VILIRQRSSNEPPSTSDGQGDVAGGAQEAYPDCFDDARRLSQASNSDSSGPPHFIFQKNAATVPVAPAGRSDRLSASRARYVAEAAKRRFLIMSPGYPSQP